MSHNTKQSPKSLEKIKGKGKKQPLPVYPLSETMEEKGLQAVEEYKSGKTIEVIDIDEYFSQ